MQPCSVTSTANSRRAWIVCGLMDKDANDAASWGPMMTDDDSPGGRPRAARGPAAQSRAGCRCRPGRRPQTRRPRQRLQRPRQPARWPLRLQGRTWSVGCRPGARTRTCGARPAASPASAAAPPLWGRVGKTPLPCTLRRLLRLPQTPSSPSARSPQAPPASRAHPERHCSARAHTHTMPPPAPHPCTRAPSPCLAAMAPGGSASSSAASRMTASPRPTGCAALGARHVAPRRSSA